MSEFISFLMPTTVPAGFEHIEYVLIALINFTMFALAFKAIMYFFTKVFNINSFWK